VGRGRLAQDQKNARRRKAAICFFDESGVSLTPIVRSTWAPRGHTPVLVHRFNWKRASIAAALCFGCDGGGCQLAFHVQPGSYDTERLIGVLGELRCFLGGQKATLLWDGLPAHRSHHIRGHQGNGKDEQLKREGGGQAQPGRREHQGKDGAESDENRDRREKIDRGPTPRRHALRHKSPVRCEGRYLLSRTADPITNGTRYFRCQIRTFGLLT
jgi:hypothetical protein